MSVAGLDERDELGDVQRRDERSTASTPARVREAGDLARPPLAGLGGRGAGGDRLLHLDEQAGVDHILELEVGEAPRLLADACGEAHGASGSAARSSSMSSADGSTGRRSGSGK